MPGSASSQQNTRTSAKARPSANVRAANLVANTPVLFRLPAIQDMAGRGTAKTEVKSDASTAAASVPMLQPQSAAAPIRAVETPAEPAMTTQPITERSWWEHWSSGVVLILLLIALATASILALQGSSSKQNPKWIAESDKVDESLSGIETSSIDKSLANIQPQSGNLALSLDNSSSNSADQRKASSLEDRKPAVHPQPDESLLSTGSLLEAESSSTGSQDSKIESPTLAQTKPREITQPDNKASVSLQAPIGKTTPSAFDLEIPESPKLGVQASPASSNVKKPAGASPDTWDSSKSDAKLDLTQPSIQFDDPNSLSSVSGNGGSLMVPSSFTATELGGQTVDAKTAQTTQPLSEPAQSKPATTTPGQGLMMTATPEWDREQLLKTFLKLREQAAGTSGNRYPQTTNVASQNAQPSPVNNQAAVGTQVPSSGKPTGYTQPGVLPNYSYNTAMPNNNVSNGTVGQPNGFNAQQVPPIGNQTYTLQPNPQPSGTTANSGAAPTNTNVPTYR